jgi:hypothetical protein
MGSPLLLPWRKKWQFSAKLPHIRSRLYGANLTGLPEDDLHEWKSVADAVCQHSTVRCVSFNLYRSDWKSFSARFTTPLHAITVNTGKLKFAVNALKQGHFLHPVDEVLSNTAKFLKGVRTVWITLKDLMAVKLVTQTKDKQRYSLDSNVYYVPTYTQINSNLHYLFVHMLVHNEQLLFNTHCMNIKVV